VYVRVYVCMDVRMYVCMDVWMYGCMDRWRERPKTVLFWLILLCFGQCAKELRHLHVMDDDDAPFVLRSLFSLRTLLPGTMTKPLEENEDR
jgi:hypothetical protein